MLDDLQIDYKISNRDVNLYWKKHDSTLDDFVRDVNSFLHNKIQAPVRLMVIETNFHQYRTSREARMYRTMLRGKEHNRIRVGR